MNIGTDSFYFKQVIGVKDISNIFRNDLCAQFLDDKHINTVIVVAENILRLELQQMGIFLQVNLACKKYGRKFIHLDCEIQHVVLCSFFINKTQFIANREFLEQAY